MNMLDSALEYAANGYYIFPCNGKIPLTKNGFKDSSNNISQVKEWWKTYPDANIGLTTGEKNGFFVIDIDIKGNGFESLKNLENDIGQKIIGTEAITGSGGLHIYFKYHKDFVIKNKTNLYSGIDIRGEGGYVIAPPSLHASGRRYTWKK